MKMIDWHTQAWDDYIYWQNTDRRIAKRINALIKDILRSPFDGIGKPEPLKFEWSGFWSRRINDEHRSVIDTNHIISAILSSEGASAKLIDCG